MQDDECRKRRVQKQIDLLITDMEEASSFDKRKEIAFAIERLWKLVQPTAGVSKPARNRPQAAPVEPIQPV